MSIVIPTMRGVLSGFSPLSLSPALWLDAADPTTLYDATTGGNLVVAGGAIARWQDKSGNARHSIQSILANRPTRQTSVQNGRDIARFDGANDFLSCGNVINFGTGSITICIVAKYATSADGAIVSKSLAGPLPGRYSVLREAAAGGLAILFQSNSSVYPPAVSDSSTASRVIVATTNRSDGLMSLAINGSISKSLSIVAESNNLATTTRLLIGAYNNFNDLGQILHFNGDISEIIIFQSAITTTNRQRVERYLGAKWGIAVA